ncbi:SDR family oxidoreductase [uncultured Paludibaculum sp.]|uniref:SDR family oxidoreductase n=1 Tax=uncultured Paludibaculum sp. TaxID=1765020 RepID=UPI002AAAE85E|nr:SDR family oxidoreductase [uncultured Paludibaculum sp.]
MNQILVTGASGILGRAIVNELAGSGMTVRQGVRRLASAQAGVASVRFDYDDPGTFGPAVAGVDGLVLMAPPLDPTAPGKMAPLVAAAKAAGVRHVVLISAFGVNHNEQAPLRVVEHMIMDSGVPYTILRPNFFMENFSTGFAAGSIKSQGAIYLAAGAGKTSFVCARDIAAVALSSFQRGLTGQELELTGPEALDHSEIAQIISEASGRPVVYHSLTEEQMVDGARAAGMPETAVRYLAVLYSVVRAGFSAGVTPDVAHVTGREPVSFRTFAQEHAAIWQ